MINMQIGLMVAAIIGSIISVLLGIILISSTIKNKKRKTIDFNNFTKEQQETINSLNQKIETLNEKCDTSLDNLNKIRQETEFELKARTQKISDTIKLLEEQKTQAINAATEAIATQQQMVDTKVKAHYDLIKQKYETDLTNTKQALLDDAQQEVNDVLSEKQAQIDKIEQELNEAQAKRDSINQEILRERAINEQRDFYRICLTDKDLEDINYLLSIFDKIRNKEVLAKLIWSEYLQNPFKRMINNVLGGKEIKNVIYKITNIDTKEIYIGKTSGLVTNRWIEHIKTSLNIGTIKSANIHKALYGKWDRFTFEVLQIVSENEKLGDCEKYWINFYQSTIYGYNMKSGG